VSDNLELMGRIARSILDSGELNAFDWREFTLVISFDDEGDVNGTYGYAYLSDGEWEAIAVDPDAVDPSAKTYREWLRNEGDKGMIKMLFQFNRNTRRVKADFEYENPKRWQVTPANIDKIVEELRPNLGTPQE
jgi:hypothetical protein